jgi:predicted lipid-binding transport protein (Tim44 family)
MHKFLSLMALVLSIGLATTATSAEAAKRVGSGKSMGTQRQAAPDKAPGAPAQSAAAPQAAAAGAAGSKSSWMGPVAGLAAGLGLAALASHLGFGDELASMVMMALLGVAVMAAIGFFLRKRAAKQRAMGAPMGANMAGPMGAMPYAMAHAGHAGHAQGFQNRDFQNAPAYKVAVPEGSGIGSAIGSGTGSAIGSGIGSGMGSAIGSGIGGSAAASDSRSAMASGRALPADFDSAAFEHNAKANFIRLQAANDVGNLDDIGQFTTPAMYVALAQDITERGAVTQKTEVLHINAQVLGLEQDTAGYLISVRFTGTIRDYGEKMDEPFDEIWHLSKPSTGNAGWLLCGIQQTGAGG